MDLSATLRSADSLFRLTPEDYIAEFPSLIPLLEKTWGEKFRGVTLRTVLPSGTVEIRSSTLQVVPATFVPDPTKTQIILETPFTLAGGVPLRNIYSIDGLTIAPWSTLYGRVPIKEWIGLVRAKKYLREAERRIAPIKEELMAAAWSPRRVERLLVAGGYDALD